MPVYSVSRRATFGLIAGGLALPAFAQEATAGLAIARAAEAQVGVVRIYDPAYVRLDFPGGDVTPERGVCTDVLIRALRVAEGLDLQLATNRDMKANFAKYPALWGLKTTDRNIDHRRVPNLRRLFERVGAEIPASTDPALWQPGDVMTCTLPGNLAHLAVVASGRSRDGQRPLIAHNIGAGTQVEDGLFEWELTGHYRLTGPALQNLRALTA